MNDWHSKCFYRISVKALIRNQKNEILVVDEGGGGRYALPGGGWDYGESLHDALKRELYEEILLTSDFRENVITTIPFFNPNKNAWQMWVACNIGYDELVYGIGDDAADVKWLHESEITTATMGEELTKQVLETYHARRS